MMDEQQLYHQLRNLLVFVERRNQLALQSHDLTVTQFDTLRLLSAKDGLRMGTLCQRILVDNSKMTRIVDFLEKEGLAERRADPDDRRAQMVVITPKGERLREVTTAVQRQTLHQQFASLSPNEKEQLFTLLTRLTNDIQSQQDKETTHE